MQIVVKPSAFKSTCSISATMALFVTQTRSREDQTDLIQSRTHPNLLDLVLSSW